MKQRAQVTAEVIDEVPLHGGGFAARHAEVRACDPATGEPVGDLILDFPDQHGRRGITAINVTPQTGRQSIATALLEHAERVGLHPDTDSVFDTAQGRSFVESVRANRPGWQQSRDDAAAVAEELARDNQRLGPGLPGYHWHSVVAGRGWEQPTLDGRNGGEDPSAWLHEAARAEDRKPPGPAAARSTSRPI